MTAKVVDKQDELEVQYRAMFNEMSDNMHQKLQSFLAESIISNSFESPELKAQISVYKPIVEAMVRALKENGILNASQNESEDIDPDIVKVITEQTEVINNQSRKIKELKMRVKLHEMISENLSGLNKEIIKEAVTKFQGESEMPEEDLLKELTKFINTRKPGSKPVQFESIQSDIDEVSAILEGSTGSKNSSKFNPKRKIDIPGLRKRVVTESTELVIPDENGGGELDPASEFLRDFGHIGS